MSETPVRYATPQEFKGCKCAPWRKVLGCKCKLIFSVVVMILSLLVSIATNHPDAKAWEVVKDQTEAYYEGRDIVVYVCFILSTLYTIAALAFKKWMQ